MSTQATNPPRSAATEVGIAAVTSAAPVAVGVLAPFLDGGASAFLGLAYAGTAALTGANYMNRIPADLAQHLPAADILAAHRTTLGISTLTTGMALALGTFGGPAATDALMAGVLQPGHIVPFVESLGWWGATLLVPYKLRNILRRPRPRAHRAKTVPAKPALPPDVADIAHKWGRYISHPVNGQHKGQILTVTHHLAGVRWQGVITSATPGQPVNVTRETVSGVYSKPVEWIHIRDGAHAGQRHITVHLTAPPELDTSTLQGAWKKWVGKAGGVMAGTHLEQVTHDPNTGGQVAYVIADEDTTHIKTPDQMELAGALRTNTLLCSYRPIPGEPRKGEIRLMKHNPLKQGVPFPGRDVLKISEGGYVQLGRHVSGFPARVQYVDPKLGAKHLFIAGVTGSGKGGTVQIVALADHVNGHAIIYGDPKGSSNPDVEDMACFSGTGEDGCMGALRVAYALLQWRIEESGRLKMKNFIPTPDRPWVRFILDEAHVPLSELQHYRKEAGIMLEALASKARSMGIILCVITQAVNADKLGGSTPLRTNVIQGGSLIMLRTDSDQQHLVTTGFEGVDPGQIPAAWDIERPLVYDEKIAMKDPESTFGLGYTLGPGGAAEMMRTFILESAAPYIDHNAIAYPADWPDWEHRHEIAATSILDGGEDGDSDGTFGSLLTGLDLGPKKPASADDKILQALQGTADPLGLDVNYAHKDAISQLSGVEGSTLDNALSRLCKTDKIHRQQENGKTIRGMYGLGPAPATEQDDDTAA